MKYTELMNEYLDAKAKFMACCQKLEMYLAEQEGLMRGIQAGSGGLLENKTDVSADKEELPENKVQWDNAHEAWFPTEGQGVKSEKQAALDKLNELLFEDDETDEYNEYQVALMNLLQGNAARKKAKKAAVGYDLFGSWEAAMKEDPEGLLAKKAGAGTSITKEQLEKLVEEAKKTGYFGGIPLKELRKRISKAEVPANNPEWTDANEDWFAVENQADEGETAQEKQAGSNAVMEQLYEMLLGEEEFDEYNEYQVALMNLLNGNASRKKTKKAHEGYDSFDGWGASADKK